MPQEISPIKPVNIEALKALVRTVPDFPKPGILFYDITTLLKDKTGFAQLIDALAAHYIARKIDLVLGIEARGFIFGPALAYRLNAGFVPVRKPRKLPAPVARVTYERRPRLCRRARLPEGPRSLPRLRRFQPAALRRVDETGALFARVAVSVVKKTHSANRRSGLVAPTLPESGS